MKSRRAKRVSKVKVSMSVLDAEEKRLVAEYKRFLESQQTAKEQFHLHD